MLRLAPRFAVTGNSKDGKRDDLMNDAELQATLEKVLKTGDVTSLSFEQGMKLIEVLVNRVESGSLSLADTMHAYERGASIIQRLREILAQAEDKITVLKKSAS